MNGITESARSSRAGQRGFSIVEVAIVLVIIGLLLGGILKGQEMMNSARVRNLADMTAAVRAAYFGFIDRYRNVPGDWDGAEASRAIGVALVSPGGNNNGRLDHPAGQEYGEPIAAWEQLAKSGFLQGNYVGGAATDEPDAGSNQAPLNAFNNVVSIGRTPDYEGVSPVALGVIVGRGVPVRIAQELDTKMDDGVPDTGVMRATAADGSVTVFARTNEWGGRESACVTTSAPIIWDVAADSQDCNSVLLF
ncbi:MAG: prepilin-type N-terminal cleavage/methylation domain-containing protein [Ectothiorhodospiraceae bacterium]|nr:prepilin-type N-terminal cleavage/methylation domain-containing protein [Chromatiales bacterium]MCP5156800.1 prepilin-type N-terminal cleavage/methylation domain-containing protein [Ectothiorhodospiraceae bacterium]